MTGSFLCPNPTEVFTIQSESFEEMKGVVGDQKKMFLEMHWVIQSTQFRRHRRYIIQPVQRIMGAKHPSVVPL